MPRPPDDTIDDFDARRTLVAAPPRRPTRPPPTPARTAPPRQAPPRAARGSSAPPIATPSTTPVAGEPRRLPAFIPAETVVPVVHYRGTAPTSPPPTAAAAPRAAAVAPRQPARPLQPAPRARCEVPAALDLTVGVTSIAATVAEPPRPAPARPEARLAPPPATGYPRWIVPADTAEPSRVPAPAPRAAPAPRPAPVPQAPPAPEARAAEPRIDLGAGLHRGQVVVVLACRGGAGATTLAVNAGAHLARAGRATCVVDLDLHLGDVFAALDLEPRTSLRQLAADLHARPDLEPAAVRRRLVLHRSGLYALGHAPTADADPRAGAGAIAGHVPALLAGLADHFDDVVVDGARGLDGMSEAALGCADQVLLVVTQDVLSVRRAARAVVGVRRIAPRARLRLVVNRARRGATIDDTAIERALGLRIDAAVRDDARVAAALDDGALLFELARARGVADDVAELAGLIDAVCRPTAARQRGGFLGRLLGGL